MNLQTECFSPLGLLKWKLGLESSSSLCELSLALPSADSAISFLFYLKLFAITCLIEAPIYFLSARGFTVKRRMLQILTLNLATHPLITWIFPLIYTKFGPNTGNAIACDELFAIAVEGLLLIVMYRYPIGKGILVSLVANLSSWWIGSFILGSS